MLYPTELRARLRVQISWNYHSGLISGKALQQSSHAKRIRCLGNLRQTHLIQENVACGETARF